MAALLGLALSSCGQSESPDGPSALDELNGVVSVPRHPVSAHGIEYEDRGPGDPVLLIHGIGIADSLEPLLREPALRDYRLILMHRRGYAGSAEPLDIFGVPAHVADAVMLLDELGIERAHVVGHSLGGSIAIQLALDAPTRVATLTLIEPAMPAGRQDGVRATAADAIGPASTAVRAAIGRAEQRYLAGDYGGAVDLFVDAVLAPRGIETLDRVLPGAIEQLERDARTLFERDPQSIEIWRFERALGRWIRAPVLQIVGGTGGVPALPPERGPSFRDVRVHVVDGLGYALPVQAPGDVAAEIVVFLDSHPLTPPTTPPAAGSSAPEVSPPRR